MGSIILVSYLPWLISSRHCWVRLAGEFQLSLGSLHLVIRWRWVPHIPAWFVFSVDTCRCGV